MSITIRPAKETDAPHAGRLIQMAIEDLANAFTGAKSEDEAIERLSQLFVHKENRFSYTYAFVIEEKAKILALASAYSEQEVDALTLNTLVLAHQLNWHIDHRIKSRLINEKEAPKGTFYIDHLAVHESARGKGFASQLINHLEQVAKENQYEEISLLADVTNPRARNLYIKLGFIPSSKVLANGHEYTALIKNLKCEISL